MSSLRILESRSAYVATEGAKKRQDEISAYSFATQAPPRDPIYISTQRDCYSVC